MTTICTKTQIILGAALTALNPFNFSIGVIATKTARARRQAGLTPGQLAPSLLSEETRIRRHVHREEAGPTRPQLARRHNHARRPGKPAREIPVAYGAYRHLAAAGSLKKLAAAKCC